MKISFTKLSGAGNDFILIDKKELRAASLPLRRLAIDCCDRRRGIGADGLLVLERRPSLPALSYFNADGSPAFCGNGSRCAAWWMYRQGWTGGKRGFAFRTSAGPLQAGIAGPERVSIRMPEPHRIRLGLKVKALGRAFRVHAINTGVPHAVLEVKDIEKVDVYQLGRALRNHKVFKPQGANINFAAFGPKGLMLRTYERGVEGETLACGTGAVASALVGFLLGRCRSPISVRVRSGETLRVSFTSHPGPPGEIVLHDIWLEGPARIVYAGEIAL